MNRRSFFKSLGKAAIGFAILPSALTYTRRWSGVLVPVYPPVLLNYVANTCGFYETLKNCGKVVEPAADLDLEKLKEVLFAIKKERSHSDVIEAYGYTDEVSLGRRMQG